MLWHTHTQSGQQSFWGEGRMWKNSITNFKNSITNFKFKLQVKETSQVQVQVQVQVQENEEFMTRNRQMTKLWLSMQEKETEWQPDPSMLSATLSVVSRNKSHIIHDNNSKNNTAKTYARGTSHCWCYRATCMRNKF